MFGISTRARRVAATGTLGALAAAIATAPANAADDCSTDVSTAAEYIAAVECASGAGAATTITLAADIELEVDAYAEYYGSEDLTIDGVGHTVSQQPGADPAVNEGAFLIASAASGEPHVQILDITVAGFSANAHALEATTVASLAISNAVFRDNGTHGTTSGAIRTGVPTVVTGSVFTGNDGHYGSALSSVGALRIENSTLSGNNARYTTIESEGALEIVASTVSGNISDDDAIIYSDQVGTSALVENSTFVDNEAPYGALIVPSNASGVLTVRHSTFADNTGEDFAHLATNSANATIVGSVFTGAEGAVGCDLDNGAETSHNFDADGSCTNNWASEGDVGEGLDAQLGALADNGGPTQTMLPLEGSPLIDAIPTTADAVVTSDQRGISRPQGEGYDIGSVEIEEAIEEDEDEDGTGSGDDSAGLVAFQVKTDGGTLYGTVSSAVAVSDINWTATGDLTGAPADTALPYGAAGFTVEVPEPGASVTVTLTAPKPFTSAYKVSDGDWVKIDGATFSADGTTVTYTLTDGGDLDEDGEANGFIVDPVALAVQATFTG